MIYANRKIHLMGTIIEMQILHHDAERILDEAVALLHEYNLRFSANDERSELMQVNRNAGIQPVKVHPELFELIQLGVQHSRAKQSHLNILIGPVVQLWRIGFADAQVPSTKAIAERLALTNPMNVQFNQQAQSVYLTEKGMSIDLGAIAKGYIADKVCDFFKAQGVTSGLINLGGNVLTFGPAVQHSDRLWTIGIQNPELSRGNHLALLKISDCSVVTSGIYERVLVKDGKSYHHILSTQTGYPMSTDVASITIVAEKSVDCEIWTTRLFGHSVAFILETVQAEPNIEVVVITQANRLYFSDGLLSKITLLSI